MNYKFFEYDELNGKRRARLPIHNYRNSLRFFFTPTPFIYFTIYFIEVQLLYKVILISAVKQSDLVIDIFIFFSIMVYYKTQNIVHCAQRRALLFPHSMYNSLNLLVLNAHPISPPPLLPLATTNLFSIALSLFLFLQLL